MCWAVQGEVSLPKQGGVLGTWRGGQQGTRVCSSSQQQTAVSSSQQQPAASSSYQACTSTCMAPGSVAAASSRQQLAAASSSYQACTSTCMAPGSVAAASSRQQTADSIQQQPAESYLHLSSRGRGSHTNAPKEPAPIRKEPCWLSGRTASLKLSEVKDVPAQVVLRSVTTQPSGCSLSHSCPLVL